MDDRISTVWEQAFALLAQDLPKPSVETWLKPIHPVGFYDDTLILGVPNEFARQMIAARYAPLIQDILQRLFDKPVSIRLVAGTSPGETAASAESLAPPSLPPPVHQSPETATMPVRLLTPLNPRYTFETFVVGNANRFGHAAALAVAEMPAKAYNPFFLYGGVGLGKTHLMQAIGHYVLRERPDMKVLYVSSETFTNELINAISDGKTLEFRNRYRTIDVLLIDDIQFLSGKERTQEEFFHTFETLHGASKQIVITSDRPPKEIPTLEERLRSRFEWGLISDIQLPDLETRIAILRKKAEAERLNIPGEVMNFIASKIETNIRELEGALIRLAATATVRNQPITPELAYDCLRDLLPATRPKAINIRYIQEVVSSYFNLNPEDLTAKKRTRSVALPRQIAMYISRELTDSSLPQIGEEFGGRDHTTVLYAYDKIAQELERNPELEATINDLVGRLRNPS